MKWSEAEIAYLKQVFATTPTKAIAQALGRPYSGVIQMAHRLGLHKEAEDLCRRRRFWQKGRSNSWSHEELERLEALYPTATRAALEAALPGRTWATIQTIAHQRGLVRRRRTSGRRRYNLAPDFFAEWSRSMAYVAGLIAADGCVYRRRTRFTESGWIALVSKDTDLLQAVAAEIHWDGPIYRSGTRGAHELLIFSPELASGLERIGITQRKSKTLGFPDVPAEYERHFVRGYFDGDGSVFWSERLHALRANFTTGSQAFAEELHRRLNAAGTRCGLSRTHGAWLVQVASRSSIERLFHYLYEGATLYLRRKYDVFVAHGLPDILAA